MKKLHTFLVLPEPDLRPPHSDRTKTRTIQLTNSGDAAAKKGFHDESRLDDMPSGLHIIGTERHESRRIDNQLRGRSGRQGDPGTSRFYLSLEDGSLMCRQ